MGDIDFATIFEQAANEAELQKIIKTYKNKIDFKAFSAVAKAAFEAIVEKKPVEEVNERCMNIIKEYIVPRGKMTLPEYYSLLESVGNVFLKYQQKKNDSILANKVNNKVVLLVKINALIEISLALFMFFIMRGYFSILSTGEIGIFPLSIILGPWLFIIGGAFQVLLTNKKIGHIVVLIGFLCVALFNLLIPSDFPQYIQPKILVFLSAVFTIIEIFILKSVFVVNKSSSKSKRNNIFKTVFVIIGAMIWWLIVLIKNPSNLGPGITLGHLLQALVIFIIALVIVKIIWRKKEQES